MSVSTDGLWVAVLSSLLFGEWTRSHPLHGRCSTSHSSTGAASVVTLSTCIVLLYVHYPTSSLRRSESPPQLHWALAQSPKNTARMRLHALCIDVCELRGQSPLHCARRFLKPSAFSCDLKSVCSRARFQCKWPCLTQTLENILIAERRH